MLWERDLRLLIRRFELCDIEEEEFDDCFQYIYEELKKSQYAESDEIYSFIENFIQHRVFFGDEGFLRVDPINNRYPKSSKKRDKFIQDKAREYFSSRDWNSNKIKEQGDILGIKALLGRYPVNQSICWWQPVRHIRSVKRGRSY